MTPSRAELLEQGRLLGLEQSKIYRFVATCPETSEDFQKALVHLHKACRATQEVEATLRWFETEKMRPPGQIGSLKIDAAMAEFEVVLHRPYRYKAELHNDLIQKRTQLEALLEERTQLVKQIESLRSTLEELTAQGTNLDHLEFKLCRIEGMVLFGHDPDPAKIEEIDQSLQQAKKRLRPHAEATDGLRQLAQAVVLRHREHLTVAQSERIQQLIAAAADPVKRRELRNLLREIENEGQETLRFPTVTVPEGSAPLETRALAPGWEALTLLTKSAGTTKRRKALEDLAAAMAKPGAGGRKATISLHRKLMKEHSDG